MAHRLNLFWRVFLSVLAVSLASILTTGVIARRTLSVAFDAYMSGRPGMMTRPGGRMMLGAAEETFLAAVDRGIVISAAVAVVIAAVAAYFLARSLARPVRQLNTGAQAIAAGRLDHRVSAEGPAEIAELAHSFNEMAVSLDEAERSRRRLVSDVAHELRNPIAALRAQAEAVAEGVLPPDERRMASMVDDITHLSRLVDELQELSVAEAGRLRYEFADVDMCALVAREAERARSIVAQGVDIGYECLGEPAEITADGFRIAQVLRNLLANAARHTTVGRITATVETCGDSVRVSVADTGEGISAEDLPHVFDRFYRSDRSRSSSTGGAGLGLAIARAIIEDHGGRVFARSVAGEGTTVGFELPLDRP